MLDTGVINPYALAEVVADRKINWREIPDRRQLLEDILRTPYQRLFDPVFDSPLYLGLRLNKDLQLERDPSSVSDLVDRHLRNAADKSSQLRRTQESSVSAALTAEIIRMIVSVEEGIEWTPPDCHWGEAGRFFNQAAEYLDPIQGIIPNCGLIAGLASIAWARPYLIAHRTHATGSAQDQFTNMIPFHSDGDVTNIEVSSRIPLRNSTGSPIYGRSVEEAETWPAIYEKAYAKLITGCYGDKPDITQTSYQSAYKVFESITGLSKFYYDTANLSPDDLWEMVCGNSYSKRTFNPMAAATYPTGGAASEGVSFSDANLVAAHYYSILGWHTQDGERYIVLRNPWGGTEAEIGILDTTIYLKDISWWRPIALTQADGVFALEVNTFKAFFKYIGGAM